MSSFLLIVAEKPGRNLHESANLRIRLFQRDSMNQRLLPTCLVVRSLCLCHTVTWMARYLNWRTCVKVEMSILKERRADWPSKLTACPRNIDFPSISKKYISIHLLASKLERSYQSPRTIRKPPSDPVGLASTADLDTKRRSREAERWCEDKRKARNTISRLLLPRASKKNCHSWVSASKCVGTSINSFIFELHYGGQQ
jgi:hypothetical protein